jgi:hypothetical protein
MLLTLATALTLSVSLPKTILLANQPSRGAAVPAQSALCQSAPTQATGCQWQKVLAPTVTKFPVQMDTHAAYAIYAFQSDGTFALNIEGRFPFAAYLSFTTYDGSGLLFDALLDRDIVPTTGSTNPFLEGALVNAPERSYRIQVLPAGQPETPNSINMPPIPPGAISGPVTLVLRTYLPEPGYDRCGGVPLPTITAVAVKDLQTPHACPVPPAATQFEFGGFRNFEQSPTPQQGQILFYRPPVAMVPFADGSSQMQIGDCTSYLMATLDASKLAIIRIPQIPTFFNNTHTDASTRFNLTQVRYLSLGSYGASQIPPPGSNLPGNIAGPDVRLTSSGAVFVITPANLPANIQAQVEAAANAKGYNILPMATRGALVAPFLIYRNKVTANGFAGSIANVPCYKDSKTFDKAPRSYAASASNMGAYAPQGVVCTVAGFLQGHCGR